MSVSYILSYQKRWRDSIHHATLFKYITIKYLCLHVLYIIQTPNVYFVFLIDTLKRLKLIEFTSKNEYFIITINLIINSIKWNSFYKTNLIQMYLHIFNNDTVQINSVDIYIDNIII